MSKKYQGRAQPSSFQSGGTQAPLPPYFLVGSGARGEPEDKAYTVNWEIFVVKIFSDSMASAKIKRTKIMCIINDNSVRGRLSENYLTQNFITQNICDAKYSRFTVLWLLLTLSNVLAGGPIFIIDRTRFTPGNHTLDVTIETLFGQILDVPTISFEVEG